jgi:hypothetical protein
VEGLGVMEVALAYAVLLVVMLIVGKMSRRRR